MSHIAKIKLQIKDLNILKRTCERLNLRFVENQKTYLVWACGASRRFEDSHGHHRGTTRQM